MLACEIIFTGQFLHSIVHFKITWEASDPPFLDNHLDEDIVALQPDLAG